MLVFRGRNNVCYIFPENIVKRAALQKSDDSIVDYEVCRKGDFEKVNLIHRDGTKSRIFSDRIKRKRRKK